MAVGERKKEKKEKKKKKKRKRKIPLLLNLSFLSSSLFFFSPSRSPPCFPSLGPDMSENTTEGNPDPQSDLGTASHVAPIGTEQADGVQPEENVTPMETEVLMEGTAPTVPAAVAAAPTNLTASAPASATVNPPPTASPPSETPPPSRALFEIRLSTEARKPPSRTKILAVLAKSFPSLDTAIFKGADRVFVFLKDEKACLEAHRKGELRVEGISFRAEMFPPPLKDAPWFVAPPLITHTRGRLLHIDPTWTIEEINMALKKRFDKLLPEHTSFETYTENRRIRNGNLSFFVDGRLAMQVSEIRILNRDVELTPGSSTTLAFPTPTPAAAPNFPAILAEKSFSEALATPQKASLPTQQKQSLNPPSKPSLPAPGPGAGRGSQQPKAQPAKSQTPTTQVDRPPLPTFTLLRREPSEKEKPASVKGGSTHSPGAFSFNPTEFAKFSKSAPKVDPEGFTFPDYKDIRKRAYSDPSRITPPKQENQTEDSPSPRSSPTKSRKVGKSPPDANRFASLNPDGF